MVFIARIVSKHVINSRRRYRSNFCEMRLETKIHQKWNSSEFVSWITASRIALIRKSLYSSHIFEERWTIKWMRFFRDLGVNLRHLLPSLLCPFVARPFPAFPPQGNHFHLRSYTTAPSTTKPETNSLSLSLGINYFPHSSFDKRVNTFFLPRDVLQTVLALR